MTAVWHYPYSQLHKNELSIMLCYDYLSHAQRGAAASKLLQLPLTITAGTRKRTEAITVTRSALQALLKPRLKERPFQYFIAAQTLEPQRRLRRLQFLFQLFSGSVLGKVVLHAHCTFLNVDGLHLTKPHKLWGEVLPVPLS